MPKGIELASRDFKNELVKIINSCGLPPSLIAYILKDMMLEIEGIAKSMVQKEEQEYQEKLKRENKRKGEIRNVEYHRKLEFV